MERDKRSRNGMAGQARLETKKMHRIEQ